MLKELIKAQSEGDHEEVGCILAEARDIKERKKRERLQKKEESFSIVKQEKVVWPKVDPQTKLEPHQVFPHHTIYSLIKAKCFLR